MDESNASYEKSGSLQDKSQHRNESSNVGHGSHTSKTAFTGNTAKTSGSTGSSGWSLDNWLSQTPREGPWTPFTSRRS